MGLIEDLIEYLGSKEKSKVKVVEKHSSQTDTNDEYITIWSCTGKWNITDTKEVKSCFYRVKYNRYLDKYLYTQEGYKPDTHSVKAKALAKLAEYNTAKIKKEQEGLMYTEQDVRDAYTKGMNDTLYHGDVDKYIKSIKKN